MPTRTSLLTELVPFSMSPLARRKLAPPRRKPELSSSITSSRELRLEPGLGAEEQGRRNEKKRSVRERESKGINDRTDGMEWERKMNVTFAEKKSGMRGGKVWIFCDLHGKMISVL